MYRVILAAAVSFALAESSSAGIVVTFTRDGGQALTGFDGVGVVEFETHQLELWLTNSSPPTSALSAYQFDFQGGDFSSGRLDASVWAESSVFGSLSPPWIPNDQSLDTRNSDWIVNGITGSLSTPFVGPTLPLDQAVLLGTIDVFIDAPNGSVVDFLLSAESGLDDEMGRLAGGGITGFGVSDVLVIPEPSCGLLILVGAGVLLRRKSS